jgi:hypothetical protein
MRLPSRSPSGVGEQVGGWSFRRTLRELLETEAAERGQRQLLRLLKDSPFSQPYLTSFLLNLTHNNPTKTTTGK